MYDFQDRINQAVFPGLQGGPHNHAIAGIAVAMQQATTSEFVDYQNQTVLNSKRLCKGLMARGYTVVTGGTDVHLVLLDLTNIKLNGARAEYILDKVSITCNKNTVPGDTSALNPSGIRLGTPALTTRGLVEEDMDVIASLIDTALVLAKKIDSEVTKLVDFKSAVDNSKDVQVIRQNVEEFSRNFPKMSGDMLTSRLSEVYPEVYKLIQKEKSRQREGLEMIASENFTSVGVLECMGSCLNNKYSEGLPGQRLVFFYFIFFLEF